MFTKTTQKDLFPKKFAEVLDSAADQKKHSKSDQRRVLALSEVKTPGANFRYYCERCTGIAFKCREKKVPHPIPDGHGLICITCLQPVMLPLKESNFIPL